MSSNVSITANVDRTVTEGQVREALNSVARGNGVALSDLQVTVTPAERRVTVTMTESDQAAYEAWKRSNPAATL